MAILGILFIRPVTVMLGAEGEMIDECVVYGRIILVALPLYMLQIEFQGFFATAEKPNLGLIITIIAGVTNIVFDALFVAVFDFGVVGAAVATAISQLVGGFLPIFYFSRQNDSLLKLVKAPWDSKALIKSTTNGFSEFLANVSSSIVGMLFNIQLLNFNINL